MKARGGAIVSVSFMAGLIGVFGYTDYCASRFAVVRFSEALRQELRCHGVTVAVLCLPAFDAQLTAARATHHRDLADGWGRVELPWAPARKHPNAPADRRRQWVFPQPRIAGRTRRPASRTDITNTRPSSRVP